MKLKLHLQSFGIAMILFGSPIIHFFRDFAHIFPDSPVLMPFFSLVWLFFIIDFSKVKLIYLPNLKLLKLASFFFFIVISWIFVKFDQIKWAKELNNYLFLILYLYAICTVKKEIYQTIFYWLIIVTLLDNLALIYSFASNPLQHFGQRAIISSKGWGEGAGNPTLYSFMAYAGIIASYLAFNKLGLKWKMVQILNIFTGFGVIFLTMTRATFFAFFLSIILGIIFKLLRNKKKEKSSIWERKFSKNNFIIISLILLLIPAVILNSSPKLLKTLITYSENSVSGIEKALETALEGKKEAKKGEKVVYADPSASGRVEGLNHVKTAFEETPEMFILGYGFKHNYIDVPVAEVFIDMGIIGLFFYLFFQFELFKKVKEVYLKSNNIWLKFWYFYFCLLVINCISRGQPYEAYFWMYYVTMIRFFTKPNIYLAQTIQPS